MEQAERLERMRVVVEPLFEVKIERFWVAHLGGIVQQLLPIQGI